MKNNGEHIVEKLTVEVTTTSSRQGYAIKNNARSFIDRCIVPAIEHYIAGLEAGMDPEQIIQIDRLSIAIDSPTSDLESSELEFTIRQEFEKVMVRTLEEIETVQQAIAAKTKKTQGQTIEAITAAASELSEDPDKLNIRTPSPEMQRIAGLFYFLEHGTRPWWSKDAAQFNGLLEEQSLLEIIAAEKTVFIRDLVAKGSRQTIRKRLIRQFSDGFLVQVLAMASAVELSPSSMSQLEQLVGRYFIQQQSVVSREALWQTIIQTVLLEIKGQRVADRSIVRELLKLVPHSSPWTSNEQATLESIQEPLQAALGLVHAITGTSATKQQYAILLQGLYRNEQGNWAIASGEAPSGASPGSETVSMPDRVAENQQQELADDGGKLFSKESPGIKLDVRGNQVKPDETQKTIQQKLLQKQDEQLRKEDLPTKETPLSKEKKQPDEQELFEDVLANDAALQLDELIVDNAGLILLHPFLKYFFSAVGILGEKDVLTDLPLAAHLLHYIATGRECDYEHSMLLEKYLVGIPLEQSIERNVPISEAIKEEIEGLLNAFKQNWPKMSGSSNDAIRETFLQRPGKLLDEAPQPRLVVERKTVDILLEELDWTISIIRFPWMKTILFVEW